MGVVSAVNQNVSPRKSFLAYKKKKKITKLTKGSFWRNFEADSLVSALPGSMVYQETKI
jgi:hypothetical protein